MLYCSTEKRAHQPTMPSHRRRSVHRHLDCVVSMQAWKAFMWSGPTAGLTCIVAQTLSLSLSLFLSFSLSFSLSLSLSVSLSLSLSLCVSLSLSVCLASLFERAVARAGSDYRSVGREGRSHISFHTTWAYPAAAEETAAAAERDFFVCRSASLALGNGD
jgi:hypothetical protein